MRVRVGVMGGLRTPPLVPYLDLMQRPGTEQPHPSPPTAALNELSAEAWVVDVTGWDHAVDRGVLARIGDPTLVCLGTHPDRSCPLSPEDETIQGSHDVTFEIAVVRIADADYLAQFREMVGDAAFCVRQRPAAVHSVLAEPGAMTRTQEEPT